MTTIRQKWPTKLAKIFRKLIPTRNHTPHPNLTIVGSLTIIKERIKSKLSIRE